MTPEEMERTIQFVVGQQAQFVSDLQEMRQEMQQARELSDRRHGQAMDGIVGLTSIVGQIVRQLAQLTDRVDRLAEKVEALADKHEALAEAQRETETRLQSLMDVVDKVLPRSHQRRTALTSQALTIVMVATSYPRFPGDTVGTFMEPIAHGVAARGHDVHMILPWHPLWQRPGRDGRVTFHTFRYAPHPALNVFGYAGALRADVALRGTAYAAAPLALAAGIAAGRRVARRVRADVMHGHWVVPGGAMAALAAPGLPLVVSLHGSDVYVAERSAIAGRVARMTFGRAGWVTSCSADLASRAEALGADSQRMEVVPYGVDASRFAPDPAARAAVRTSLGLTDATPLVFAVGRFVRKKGFEFLIDAASVLAARHPGVVVLIAGDGDLRAELEVRARAAGMADTVRFPGLLPQDAVGRYLSAADVAVVPSVRDSAGNVDGLPNVVMEALASATPLVTTPAGGIAAVVTDGDNGLLVPERDAGGLAAAVDRLLSDAALRSRLGTRARARVVSEHGWDRVAERFERAYLEARAR